MKLLSLFVEEKHIYTNVKIISDSQIDRKCAMGGINLFFLTYS